MVNFANPLYGRRILVTGGGPEGESPVATIKADLIVFADVEDEFGTVLRAVNDELGDLDRQLREHLKDWSGPAQEAYRVAHAEWQAASQRMARILAGLHKGVGVAHANHRKAYDATLLTWKI